MTFSDTLHAAIDSSGMTPRDIFKRSIILAETDKGPVLHESSLSRFRLKNTGLSIKAMNRLGQIVGLKVELIKNKPACK